MQPENTRPSARAFFVVTYLLSWAIWIPLVLSHFGIGPLHVPEGVSQLVRLAGVLMPSIAAMLLTLMRGGGRSLRGLLGRLGIWRVGWRWWAAAVVVQPLLLLLAAGFFTLLRGAPAIQPAAIESAALLGVNIFFLALATLGEEIGWRGVALPALQARHGPLPSSVILGVLAAVWHIPFWLLLDTWDTFGLPYLALNFLFIPPLTLFLTWVFNHTRGSLLLPVAMHLAFNLVNVAWLPVTASPGAFAIIIALEWLLAVAIWKRVAAGTAQVDSMTSGQGGAVSGQR